MAFQPVLLILDGHETQRKDGMGLEVYYDQPKAVSDTTQRLTTTGI